VATRLKCPLRLTFEVREGEKGGDKIKMPPSDSRLKQGRGMGGDMVGQNSKHPLRLAFEAREGERVVDKDVKRPSDSHLKRGRGMGGDEIEMPPSASRLRRGRGNGWWVKN